MLNTSIPIPETFLGGSATVDCDQQVAAIGIHSENQPDGVNITFSTLPPTILPTPQFQNTAGLWDGTWKDAMIVTRVDSTNPALPPCQGLINCGGTNFALTAELDQSGAMVTGTLKSVVFGADVELMVAGEVSDDGTLSLSSEDPASFVFSGIPLMATLSSWESRQDTLGTMTGSLQFNISLTPHRHDRNHKGMFGAQDSGGNCEFGCQHAVPRHAVGCGATIHNCRPDGNQQGEDLRNLGPALVGL